MSDTTQPPERPGEPEAKPAGGWASQPLALRILLVVSITAIVVGVVKCSMEVTPPAAPIASLGILPVAVDAPEELLPASADSMSHMAARQFARILEGETELDIRMIDDESAEVEGIAVLSLEWTRGSFVVSGEIRSRETGAVLAEVFAEGPAERLYAVVSVAAGRTGRALGLIEEPAQEN
jgi:hypothetical protein